MSNIIFSSENIDFQLEKPLLIKRWIASSVQNESFNIGEISITFTSDDFLLKINQKHLNHDYFTDIITFDYSENSTLNGDLFISIDRVRDNAKEFGDSFANELSRVVIHGVLHLCGYKDKSAKDEALMREKENFYLSLQKETEISW